MPVNTSITFRKGSSSQWSATNPVLASGEPGYDLTNNILKIGDGVSAWNSLSNHSHSSSDITNFNSSVSGLLPTITNSGNNRILTSTGSSVGINAEEKLTFDGTALNVVGSGLFSDGIIASGVSKIGGFTTQLYCDGDFISIKNNDKFIYSSEEGRFNDFNEATAINYLERQLWGTGLPIPLLSWGNNDNIGIKFSFLDIPHYTLDVNGSGNFSSGLYVNSIPVSISGHTHRSSNIIDFNSSVSGLLPVKNIVSGSGIDILNNNGIFTVSVTGNFGLTGEQVDDRVNGLLIAGNNIVLNYDDNNNNLTISTSGLQPSGNYSVVGHTHSSSNITDFNSSVSGLLPVTNILSGTNIIVSSNSGIYTIGTSGVQSLFTTINNTIVGNTSISAARALRYNALTFSPVTADITLPSSGHLEGDVIVITSAGGSFANGSVLSIKNPLGQTLNTITKQNESYRYISESNGAPNAWSKVLVDSHSHVSSDITNFNTSVSGLVSGIYAPLNNPSFIGIPTVPTANSGTNTNQIASTSFVRTEISNLLASAPSTLDTLNELATALGNDANFSTTVTNNLAGKANLSGASFTGTITAPTGNFTTLQQNGVAVSVSGHTHTASQITNFNTSVSGLVSGIYYLNSNPSGYTNNVGTVTSVSALTLGTAGTDVSSSVSNSTSTPVITLNIPSASATNRGVLTSSDWTTFNNKQPSGNYSAVGHSHTSSDITNFNSSVSGLLPVKNILAGSGVAVSGNLEAYTVSVGIIDCGIIAPTSIFIPPTVAYYAFNANVTDANALYDGTAYGSPSFVSGYVGNAIQLNSPSKYVTVPRSISTNWTISFFVRTASASPSSNNWYDGVSLLNGEMPGDVNDFGVVYLNNKVSVGIGNPDTTIFSLSTINNNVWRHVCVTRNSTTGQVKIYIDGTLETTANMPTGTKSAASTLIIGGSIKYGSFNGLIDNMKIFDSVLTDAQISSLATGN